MSASAIDMHLVGRPDKYDAAGNCFRSELKPSVAMAIFQAKVVRGERTTWVPAFSERRPFATEEMLARLNDAELCEFARLIDKMSRYLTEYLEI